MTFARVLPLSILSLALSVLPTSAAAPGDFTEPGTSPETVGQAPYSVATADFDRDNDQDLAVANVGADVFGAPTEDVTILLGSGTGDFTEPGTSPETAGNGSDSVAAGNLNGDEFPDLAVANGTGGNVTILLGTGAGDFTEKPGTSPEAAGSTPFFVATAFLNGDSNLDLAVVNNVGSGTVTILLGDGTGDFTAAPTSPETVGMAPYSVAVADFNGDGDSDLAVSNAQSSTITILLGDGTGNFTEPATSPEMGVMGPRYVAAGDLNGDGRQDFAVANDASHDVSILLGDGTGNFAPAPTSPEPVGMVPYSLVAVDLTGDSRRDLAVGNYASNDVTILFGDGTGNFTEPPTSPEGADMAPVSLAATDMNNDGAQDLAVVNQDVDNVTILVNEPVPPQPSPAPTGVCKGKPATLTGTVGSDTLTGTSGPDIIAALGGNDRVKAQAGKDLVCAGDGNDLVNGGVGKDLLLGQGGNDKLKGSVGADKVQGGGGKDICTGGGGKDKAGCEKEKSVP